MQRNKTASGLALIIASCVSSAFVAGAVGGGVAALSTQRTAAAIPKPPAAPRVEETTPVTNPTAKPNVPADPKYLDGWRMAGANPERTSWVPEEVRGQLKPLWFKPLEPYIQQKVQLIAADGLLYVSTARGLYALDAETGQENWVYPTAMPLGHSPTVVDGVAYVGCFDRRVQAPDTETGKGIWISEPAGAGFHCDPLVVDGKVYAGNRDNFLYCLDAKTGKALWKFETQGMVLFSPACKDGVVYFASNDAHAYAVNAHDGKLVWRSEKLPGGEIAPNR